MRNLKRVLALAMAMVMILGMMVIGSSAASYSDAAAIDEDYAVAVEVLSGMGVFKGTGAGFAPKQILTRAEAAALIYRVITGDTADKQVQNYDYASLKDIQAGQWYTGYVTYANNGGYIKGDDLGNFNPYAQVTGIQVMAIMLRAAGYGQNGEYEGAAWMDNILTDARELGITGSISTSTLNAPATRELVAQLIFNAITEVKMVSYAPLLGYYEARDAQTLGEKTFNLADADSQDVWGRPATIWYNAKKGQIKGVYATIEETPVATYTTKVDECDIAKDAGLKKTTDIEASYVDGEPVKVDDNYKIEPLQTRKFVGDQGVLTEVYDMGDDGVRIVEINTYLAKVVDVEKATTDKNGHTTDAYVTFEIYGVKYELDYETEDFAKFQYALVTVSNPNDKDDAAVESAEATAPETVGYTTDWDDDTTTIGKTEYDDAYKFVLNYGTVKSATDTCWDVFVDQYGNIIGAVETGTNYLVIEKIEWKHAASTIGGGYALADVVLADGTKVEGVTVAEIDGEAADNFAGVFGGVYLPNVADDYVNNFGYYEHIWTYTVDEDGAYSIVPHDDEIGDYEDVKVVNGQATIGTLTNNVVATTKTVFLVKEDGPKGATTYEYDVYVGKNEVPSGTADDMCVLTDRDGYAKLVVLTGFVPEGNTFLAYITDTVADGNSARLGEKHKVYKVGETDATIVYDKDDVLTDLATGLYTIKLNNQGIVESVSADFVADLSVDASYVGTDWTVAGVSYNRVLVEGKENNTSFSTQEYSALTDVEDGDNDYTATTGAAWKDFNADEDTVVIKVIKEGFNGDAKLVPADMNDVAKGDVVIVGYTTRGTINNAQVIYVMVNEHEATPVSTYAWKYVGATMDSKTGAEIEIALVKDGKTVQALKSASNLTVTVAVYNKAGTLVYSTTVDAAVNASGNLLVNAPHTLGANNEYMAVVTISGSSYVDGVQAVETPYIEAQTATSAE